MAQLLRDFADAVARHPARVAIVDGRGRETTFAALGARVETLARGWRARGVRAGDRVLLAMPLDADLYSSLAALWSLGATVVLPEPAMGIGGLRHAARVAGATAFCSGGLFGALKYALPELWPLRHLRPKAAAGAPLDLPPPDESDIALISFTSGTTGAPKAIPRSHGFLAAQHAAVAPMLHSARAERDLVTFPVFVLINIASGQTSVLPGWKMSKLADLAPATLTEWIVRHGATRALLPPALCAKLAEDTIPASLTRIFTGGGPVFPDILDQLSRAGPHLAVTCVYGSTEAEPIAHLDAAGITREDRADMTAGRGLLVGHPVPQARVRIVDHEIQVAGGHVNAGYLDPAHDAENKVREGGVIWHRTGDAGFFDAAGRLWLLGRTGSEVALARGTLFPFSVEVAARGWEGVVACALVADEPQAAAGIAERAAPGNAACLVIEGDGAHLPLWQDRAAALGIARVRRIDRIPMDRRHASKVDRAALARLLSG